MKIRFRKAISSRHTPRTKENKTMKSVHYIKINLTFLHQKVQNGVDRFFENYPSFVNLLSHPFSMVEKTTGTETKSNRLRSALTALGMGAALAAPEGAAAADRMPQTPEPIVVAGVTTTATTVKECIKEAKALEGKTTAERIEFGKACAREVRERELAEQRAEIEEQQMVLAMLDHQFHGFKVRLEEKGLYLYETAREGNWELRDANDRLLVNVIRGDSDLKLDFTPLEQAMAERAAQMAEDRAAIRENEAIIRENKRQIEEIFWSIVRDKA